MRLALTLALLVVAVPLMPAAGQFGPGGPSLGERVFVLVMEGNRFNAENWPDTPLLEAYVGETMTFVVHVPLFAEPHTFHLHGHPWFDDEVGRFIDTKLLFAGDTHTFTARAGGQDGHAGDWLYHCHIDQHFEEGMFGVLRVYAYAMAVDVEAGALVVRLDRLGVAVEGATLAVDGEAVAARERSPGTYVVPVSGVPARGELVIGAHHDTLGEGVWRGSVTPAGAERAPATPSLDEVLEVLEGTDAGALGAAGAVLADP